jgi:hypothetical protein
MSLSNAQKGILFAFIGFSFFTFADALIKVVGDNPPESAATTHIVVKSPHIPRAICKKGLRVFKAFFAPKGKEKIRHKIKVTRKGQNKISIRPYSCPSHFVQISERLNIK